MSAIRKIQNRSHRARGLCLGVDPADGTVHVAAHHGLFELSDVGTTIGRDDDA